MPKKTKNSLPLWPAAIVLIIILIFALLNPLCRYFYTKNFIARSDVQLAELLAAELAENQITDFSKPIFFFGSAKTRTNGACLDLSTGRYNLYSAFDAADTLGLDTLESSRYIVDYLESIGYQYTAPTAENLAICQAEIDANIPLAQSFPWFNSIMETEHGIFVQLSGSVYDIHFKVQ